MLLQTEQLKLVSNFKCSYMLYAYNTNLNPQATEVTLFSRSVYVYIHPYMYFAVY